jgi:phage terminase small subunit
MKLTNRQLDTLAAQVATKVNNRYDKAKKEIEDTTEVSKLSKQEEKGFKLIEQALELFQGTDVKNLIEGNYYDKSDSTSLKKFKDSYVERNVDKKVASTLKAKGYAKVTTEEIADKLVLASIDSDSVDTLVKNLAKELGLKPVDIQ